MKINPILFCALTCALVVGTARAEEELRFSREGKLTNVKDTRELEVVIRPARKRERPDIDGLVKHCAGKYGLPPSLIRAVIQAESNWDPLAVSHKGAMGLMQLMPETAEMLGVTNAFDPAQNIEGGTRYLAELLEAFNGRLDLALAGYNAGPTVVSSLGRIPQNRETPHYVTKVLGVFRSQGGVVPDAQEEMETADAEAEVVQRSKKPFVASESVILCEDERGMPLITNTGVAVFRGG